MIDLTQERMLNPGSQDVIRSILTFWIWLVRKAENPALSSFANFMNYNFINYNFVNYKLIHSLRHYRMAVSVKI